MFEILKNERFSIVFSSLIIAVSGVSLLFDFMCQNEMFWFQRSGALIVLAGVELQYSKVISLWQTAVNREKEIESVETKIESGKGINMKELAEESEKTRAFSLRIHDAVTKKSSKESIAVILLIANEQLALEIVFILWLSP